MADDLTPLQRRFVQEYLIDLNAAQAYIRAGYAPSGAYSDSYRLLEDDRISQEIAKAMQERGIRCQVAADDVVLEFKRLAFSNLCDLFSWDDKGNVTIRPKDELTVDQQKALKSIKHRVVETPTKFGEPIVKKELDFAYHDKVASLIALGKHVGMAGLVDKKLDKKALEGPNDLDFEKLTPEERATWLSITRKMSADPNTIPAVGRQVDDAPPA